MGLRGQFRVSAGTPPVPRRFPCFAPDLPGYRFGLRFSAFGLRISGLTRPLLVSWQPWGSLGVALECLWGRIGVPISWLSTRFVVALRWLWVALAAKSETQTPKAERRPKSEAPNPHHRSGVAARRIMSYSGFDLLSGFGLRPSEFHALCHPSPAERRLVIVPAERHNALQIPGERAASRPPG